MLYNRPYIFFILSIHTISVQGSPNLVLSYFIPIECD